MRVELISAASISAIFCMSACGASDSSQEQSQNAFSEGIMKLSADAEGYLNNLTVSEMKECVAGYEFAHFWFKTYNREGQSPEHTKALRAFWLEALSRKTGKYFKSKDILMKSNFRAGQQGLSEADKLKFRDNIINACAQKTTEALAYAKSDEEAVQ